MEGDNQVRIVSFDIAGYRSCIQTHVELNESLSALIGPNGSGKTNVLQGLLLLKKLEKVRHSEKHRRQDKKTNACKLRVVFQIGKIKITYIAVISYLADELNADEITDADERWIIDFPDGKSVNAEYPLSLLRVPVREAKWMYFEHVSRKDGQDKDSFNPSEVVKLNSKFEETVQVYVPILVEIAKFVSKMNYYSASQYTNPANCPAFFELASENYFARRYAYPRANLAHVRFLKDLHNLNEKNEVGFQEYSSLIGKEGLHLVDKVEFHAVDLPSSDIELQTGGKIVKTKVKRTLIVPHFVIHGAKLSPAQLSEGTFKTLAVLLYLSTDKSDLLLLEEPEVCIHHGLLCSLIDLVKTHSNEKQIVLSTHSDYVLDMLKPENVLLVKIDKRTGTTVNQLSSALSARNYEALKNYLLESGNLGEYWRHTGFEDG